MIYRADAMQTMRRFADPADGTIYVEKTLTEAARAFGITANALGYRTDGEDVALCSLLENKHIAILAESFESYGTIRFVHEFPLINPGAAHRRNAGHGRDLTLPFTPLR